MSYKNKQTFNKGVVVNSLGQIWVKKIFVSKISYKYYFFLLKLI